MNNKKTISISEYLKRSGIQFREHKGEIIASVSLTVATMTAMAMKHISTLIEKPVNMIARNVEKREIF